VLAGVLLVSGYGGIRHVMRSWRIRARSVHLRSRNLKGAP